MKKEKEQPQIPKHPPCHVALRKELIEKIDKEGLKGAYDFFDKMLTKAKHE